MITSGEYTHAPRCPSCESSAIEALGCIEREHGKIARAHTCRKCSGRWLEIYGLIGMERLGNPERKVKK